MPRVARVDIANHPYHVLNRAIMRLRIFSTGKEYEHFEKIIEEAAEKIGMKIIAYTIMPNHWHFLLYPEKDGDLGLFMHQLTNTHIRQVKSRTKTIGTGPLYQGRYKSFIIQKDEHFLTILKYIERNPVRAGLAACVEDWHWGSAWRRVYGTPKQKKLLADSPVELPANYRHWVNTPESPKELEEIRTSVNKARPYGAEDWIQKTVKQFNLGATLHNPGRPRGGNIQ
jgi:putative transposase